MVTEALLTTSAAFDPPYAKTARGRAEVEGRSLGLNARQRSLLIMIDGRRPRSALAAVLPAATVDAALDALAALDLIEPAHASAPVAVPASAPAPASASVSAPASASASVSALPIPAETAARLARIKAQMVETAHGCLGLLAADVVRRIAQAGDAQALLAVVGHWHMALQESKLGRDVALAQVEQVSAALREAVAA